MNQAKTIKRGYSPAEHPRTATDKAFRISLYLKGLDGALEIIGGILLLLVKPEQISHFARWLTQSQLSRDPDDWLANHIIKSAHNLTGAALVFGAFYLLSQGVVKVVLVYQVFHDRVWAYLALIALVSVFAIYQVYRLVFVKFSIGLFALTVFDLLIIYLTQNEYRRHHQRLKHSSSS